jgi:hypothetical protein
LQLLWQSLVEQAEQRRRPALAKGQHVAIASPLPGRLVFGTVVRCWKHQARVRIDHTTDCHNYRLSHLTPDDTPPEPPPTAPAAALPAAA